MVELSLAAIVTAVAAVICVGALFALVIARIAEWIWTMIDKWTLDRRTREAWRNLKSGRMR